jgi:hypothetical protein
MAQYRPNYNACISVKILLTADIAANFIEFIVEKSFEVFNEIAQ